MQIRRLLCTAAIGSAAGRKPLSRTIHQPRSVRRLVSHPCAVAATVGPRSTVSPKNDRGKRRPRPRSVRGRHDRPSKSVIRKREKPPSLCLFRLALGRRAAMPCSPRSRRIRCIIPAARSLDSSVGGRAAGISLISRAAATPTLRAYQSALRAAGITIKKRQPFTSCRNCIAAICLGLWDWFGHTGHESK
jgi:hypothetical protein